MAGKRIWEHLLKIAETDELQTQVQYRIGSQTHRAKLRLWQILVLCSPFVSLQNEIDRSLPRLLKILKAGNISSVRMYVEWSVSCLLSRNPKSLKEYIFPILLDYERRHEALPACILIAFQVFFHPFYFKNVSPGVDILSGQRIEEDAFVRNGS